jgi:hypothetical protein
MSVQIHGKNYITVNERVIQFRKDHPNFSIESDMLRIDENSVIIKTVIRDESGRLLSSGIATEDRRSSKINSTNYVENCETSAVGRALAFLGYGIEESIASADEVQSAIVKQSSSGKADELNAKIDDLLISRVIPDKMTSRIFELKTSGMSIVKMQEIISALEKLPIMEITHD